MLHRSSLVWPNNNPGSTTYLNINLAPSQAAILGHLHTLEDHQILTKFPSCLLPRASNRILCREDKEGYELPRLTGPREATDHPVMSGITLA